MSINHVNYSSELPNTTVHSVASNFVSAGALQETREREREHEHEQ